MSGSRHPIPTGITHRRFGIPTRLPNNRTSTCPRKPGSWKPGGHELTCGSWCRPRLPSRGQASMAPFRVNVRVKVRDVNQPEFEQQWLWLTITGGAGCKSEKRKQKAGEIEWRWRMENDMCNGFLRSVNLLLCRSAVPNETQMTCWLGTRGINEGVLFYFCYNDEFYIKTLAKWDQIRLEVCNLDIRNTQMSSVRSLISP